MLLSPHTAGLSVRENKRVVAGFLENLRRYLSGAELLDCLNSTDSNGGS